MSADELKVFEAGEDILASDTNDNNTYILNQITTSSGQLITQIESLTANVESLISSLSDYVTLAGAQTISGNKTFSGTVSVPNSSALGTALNTRAISKSNNGYLRLGNGILIQWGESSTHSTNDKRYTQVTFPTAFSDDNFKVISNTYNSGMSNDRSSWINSKTTTGCVIANASANLTHHWIAIGY